MRSWGLFRDFRVDAGEIGPASACVGVRDLDITIIFGGLPLKPVLHGLIHSPDSPSLFGRFYFFFCATLLDDVSISSSQFDQLKETGKQQRTRRQRGSSNLVPRPCPGPHGDIGNGMNDVKGAGPDWSTQSSHVHTWKVSI